jgi:hypothetical protein
MYKYIYVEVGGELEYLYHNSGSHKRRHKGNPMPGAVLFGHPVPGGYKVGNLALQFGRVSGETVKYG